MEGDSVRVPEVSTAGTNDHWVFVVVSLLGMLLVAAFVSAVFRELALYVGPIATGDFKIFWAIGGVLLEGGNPRDYEALRAFSLANGGMDPGDLPIFYPAFTFPLLLPLGLLPFSAARWFFVVTVLALYLCVFFRAPLARLFTSKQSYGALIELFFFLTFIPFGILWWNHGFTAVMFFALIGFLRLCDRRGRWESIFSGVLLGLVLAKPNIAYLVYPFILTQWLMRRDFWRLSGFALCVSLLGLMSLLFDARSSDISLHTALAYITPTVPSMIEITFGLPTGTRLFVNAAAIAATFVAALRFPRNKDLAACVAIHLVPLSLITTPYAWSYDFSLLATTVAVSLALIVGREKETLSSYYIVAGSAFLLSNTLLLFTLFPMHRQWWYPLTIWLIAALMQQRASSSVKSLRAR